MKAKHLVSGAIPLALLVGVTWASSGGPPNARTGAPGESTCLGCHSSFALNSGSGSLAITGPTAYQAGDTLDMSVDLSQLGQSRWGFELTVLDASNNAVGTIIVSDAARTQLSSSGGRQYIKHTSVGTDNGTADASPGWSFRWAAPASSGTGDVTFYVAGNAANGNGNTQGDYIYTATTTLGESLPTVTCYVDADEDGFGDEADAGTVVSGSCGSGFVDNNLDCDDTDPNVNPDADEVADDSIDQNCDGVDDVTCYADTDSDGYGDPGNPAVFGGSCGVGYVVDSTDNCPTVSNPDQLDTDGDDIGDACDNGCCIPPSVGDCDQSGAVDITDISVLIDNQFLTLTPLVCEAEGDCDYSGVVDITDLSILIDNQFLTLTPLPPCP